MGDSARKGKGQVEQHNFGKTDSNNPLVTRTCAFLCAEIIIESPALEKHVMMRLAMTTNMWQNGNATEVHVTRNFGFSSGRKPDIPRHMVICQKVFLQKRKTFDVVHAPGCEAVSDTFIVRNQAMFIETWGCVKTYHSQILGE